MTTQTHITPYLHTTAKEIRYTVEVNGHKYHIIDGLGKDANGNPTGYQIMKDGMVRRFAHNMTLDKAIAQLNEMIAEKSF
jgi:hypothetical protein